MNPVGDQPGRGGGGQRCQLRQRRVPGRCQTAGEVVSGWWPRPQRCQDGNRQPLQPPAQVGQQGGGLAVRPVQVVQGDHRGLAERAQPARHAVKLGGAHIADARAGCPGVDVRIRAAERVQGLADEAECDRRLHQVTGGRADYEVFLGYPADMFKQRGLAESGATDNEQRAPPVVCRAAEGVGSQAQLRFALIEPNICPPRHDMCTSVGPCDGLAETSLTRSMRLAMRTHACRSVRCVQVVPLPTSCLTVRGSESHRAG